MELNSFFKSIIEQDVCSVVICDTAHRILYMNPAAINKYSNGGGAELVGSSLLDCHNENSCEMIEKVLAWFEVSCDNNRVHIFYNEKQNKDVYMVALRENGRLIGYYEKHEFRTKDETPFYNF